MKKREERLLRSIGTWGSVFLLALLLMVGAKINAYADANDNNINNENVFIINVDAKIVDGVYKKPSVSITFIDDDGELTEGIDFEVDDKIYQQGNTSGSFVVYNEIPNVGETYFIHITGKGQYTGDRYAPFSVYAVTADELIYLFLDQEDIYVQKPAIFNMNLLDYSMYDDDVWMEEGTDYEIVGIRFATYDENTDDYIAGSMVNDYSKMTTGDYLLEAKGLGKYQGKTWHQHFYFERYTLKNYGSLKIGSPVSLEMIEDEYAIYSFTTESAGEYTFCSESASKIDPDAEFFSDGALENYLDSSLIISGSNDLNTEANNYDFCHVLKLKANQTVYMRITGYVLGKTVLHVAAGKMTREQVIAADEKGAKDQSAADAVKDAIAALPDANNVTVNNKAAINAAKDKFNGLTNDQKALVPQSLKDKLNAVVEALAKAEKAEADKAAAGQTTPAAPQVVPQAAPESITIPKKPTSVKVKVKKNKVTVSWKKIKKKKKTKALLKKIKGVQVQCSLDKTFKQIVMNKKLGKSKTKVKLKLQKKKTYYIRVRYFGNGGFSKWSKVRRAKTK